VRKRSARIDYGLAEHFRWVSDLKNISAKIHGYGFKSKRDSASKVSSEPKTMGKVKILFWIIVSGAVASMEQLEFLSNLLPAVHKEQSISTLLLMQSNVHGKDLLQGLYPLVWPIIRLDETQRVELVNHYNKNFLAMVYMESEEDIILLPALAGNFNHMREVRIVIFLEFKLSKKFIGDISYEAEKYKLLNILMIEKSLKTLRLYPFPQPTFQVIDNLLGGNKIFPVSWRNFMGKIALTDDDLVPPRSFYLIEPKTGRKRHAGFVYKFFKNFAGKHNITLQQQIYLDESTSQVEIIDKTIRGELDLPITGQMINLRHPNESRTEALLGFVSISIVVPCGQEVTMLEKFRILFGFANHITFFGCYILLSAVDFVLRTLYDRLEHHHYRFQFQNLVVNLRVLQCILSLSIPMGNRLRSVVGQLTIVMSFTGVILASMLSAQLSTLLTTSPQYRHVMNFQELYESNLTVVTNRLIFMTIQQQIDPKILSQYLTNTWIVRSEEQVDMIKSFNTTYAYQAFTHVGDPFTKMQQHSARKAFCKSPKLDLVNGVSVFTVLPQNSIYAFALQDYSSRVWSAGLLSYWLDEAIQEVLSSTRTIRFEKLPFTTRFIPRKLQDYTGSWKILLSGWSLAFCVFIAEVLLDYLRCRYQ